jgi:hypothetical protein
MAKLSNYRVHTTIPGEPGSTRTIIIEATNDVKAWEAAVATCRFYPILGQEEVKAVYRSEVSQQINWVKIIKPYIDEVKHD